MNRDLRSTLGHWLLRAVLAAALAAALELAATLAAFPTALSRPGGALLAGLGCWWIFVAWLLPFSVVGAALDARGRLAPWLAWRRAPLLLPSALLLAWAARWASRRPWLDEIQVVRGSIELLWSCAAIALTLAGLVALSRWLGRREAAWLDRLSAWSPAFTLGLSSLGCLFGIHALIVRANADAPAGPFAVLFLLLLLLTVRALTPSMPATRPGSAAAIAVVWMATLPLVSLSPHALFVLRGHCPTATSLYRPLDGVGDLDGDGTRTRWLGGTDCDDLQAQVGPLRTEIVGDGLDQDCRGGDAEPRSRRTSAPLWSDCKPLADPPSVLLVTVGSLRADALTSSLMPALHGLASRAARFERAYPPASTTSDGMLSVFAGRALSDLRPASARGHRPIVVERPITDAFRQAGYHAFALFPPELHPALASAFSGLRHVRPRDVDVDGHPRLRSADLSNQLMEEIASTPERYFAWVHYPDLEVPDLLKREQDEGTGPAYRRALTYVDDNLGRVLGFLQRSGRLARTLVIVTSNHGAELGERGREGHGGLFEEGIRVPLVVWIPGCGARRVTHPTSLRDLAGSLHAITGIGDPEPTIFAEGELPVVVEAQARHGRGLHRAVILSRLKLLVDVPFGGRMLFDLRRDPHELDDLYGVDVEATDAAERAYQRWLDAPGVR